ncbi:MAG: SPFH domain-containing protein [Caldilineaceae bacterium]
MFAVIRRAALSRSGLILAPAPYLLLLGVVLIALALVRFQVPGALFLWGGLRWSIRLLLIGGTYVGWRLTVREHRPLWWYSWLGFATYELVGLLLMAVFALMNGITYLSATLGLLGLPLGALAFLPYVIVAIAVAQRDRRLALLTIFPHAALTAPLFILAMSRFITTDLDPTLLRITALPLAVAAVVVALLVWRQQEHRWLGLYGGMAVCQSAFALSLAWNETEAFLVMGALPLIVLGALILSGPLLLLPIGRLVAQLIQRLGGGTVLQRFQQGRQMLRHTLASLSLAHPWVTAPTAVAFSAKSQSGGFSMSELTTTPAADTLSTPGVGPGLERLYKLAVVILAAVIVGGLLLFVGRSAIYKIHEYERGLHLRGGRFLAAQGPGWHVQIPLVDTVIIVKVNERLGYVERIEAMTSDNVTMFVSLQYTYRVTEPQQYALQVDDPERIVFEFVQGRLRDVVNTKAMAAVMNDRALMNQEVMDALKEKESQYGVQFATVQLQSASPPDEVLTAIKDRMVATQRQEQAQAEAAQQKTIADAELYTAQKRAEATAYEISRTAEADAERIRLTTEAQQLAIRAVLAELEGKGALADKFIDYLIAQELKDNSKWIINGEGTPIVDLQ